MFLQHNPARTLRVSMGDLDRFNRAQIQRLNRRAGDMARELRPIVDWAAENRWTGPTRDALENALAELEAVCKLTHEQLNALRGDRDYAKQRASGERTRTMLRDRFELGW